MSQHVEVIEQPEDTLEHPTYPVTVPVLHTIKDFVAYSHDIPIIGRFVHLGHTIADATVERIVGLEGGCAALDARLEELAPMIDATVIAPQVAKYKPVCMDAYTTTVELAKPVWDKVQPYAEHAMIAGKPIVTATIDLAGPLLSRARDAVAPTLEAVEATLDKDAAALCDRVDVSHVVDAVEHASA
jgi:hypothetical protein